MFLRTLLAISLVLGALAQANALECYKCDSSALSDCIADPTKAEKETCDTSKDQVCVTKLENGKITRGCQATEIECKAPTCYSTTDNLGNTNRICQSCDSSKDSDCIQNAAANNAYNEICEKPDTECLSIIVDKNLQRSCATTDLLTKCTADTKVCKRCSTPNCNIGIFPESRIRCYQCSDANCKNPQSISAKPCTLYDEADKCYMHAETEDKTIRGCVSDASNNKCAAGSTDALCYTCDKDNCNDMLYNKQQSLKCIQCTSKEDSNCMWGQAASAAKNCNTAIKYNDEEKCYTQKMDGVVYRGCFYDRSADLKDCTGPDCTTCTESDGCNSKDLADFTCIRCRSDIEPKCEHESKDVGGSACRNAVTAGSQDCFEGVWNKVVIRGCMVDADEQAQALCDNTSKDRCTSCTGKDCNTADRSGSDALRSSSTLLMAIVGSWLLLKALQKAK